MIPIGTKITMIDSPDNEYLYQGKNKNGRFMTGEIMGHFPHDMLCYKVRWDNGDENTYGNEHIKILSEIVNRYEIY